MIKDEQQRTEETKNKVNSSTKGVAGLSGVHARQIFFRRSLRMAASHNAKLMRKNVSRKVMDAAERMMKEYEADLEYLKDK